MFTLTVPTSLQISPLPNPHQQDISSLPSRALNLSQTNLSDSDLAPVTCYPPNPSPGFIKRQDCTFMLREYFIKHPEIHRRYRWSYNYGPHIEKVLPDDGRWEFGTCIIEVLNFYHEEEDVFSLWLIATTAGRILEKCVAAGDETERLGEVDGGHCHIGWVTDHFYVAVRAPVEGAVEGNGTASVVAPLDTD